MQIARWPALLHYRQAVHSEKNSSLWIFQNRKDLSRCQHQVLGLSCSPAVSERHISLSSHPITAQSARYYFSLGGRFGAHKSAKREERQGYNHAVLFYCRTATNTEFLNEASGPHLTRSAAVSQHYHSYARSGVTQSQICTVSMTEQLCLGQEMLYTCRVQPAIPKICACPLNRRYVTLSLVWSTVIWESVRRGQ